MAGAQRRRLGHNGLVRSERSGFDFRRDLPLGLADRGFVDWDTEPLSAAHARRRYEGGSIAQGSAFPNSAIIAPESGSRAAGVMLDCFANIGCRVRDRIS